MFYKEKRICFRRSLVIGSGGGLGTAAAKEMSSAGENVVMTRTQEHDGVKALRLGSPEESEQLQLIAGFLGKEVKAIIFGQVGGSSSAVDTLLGMTLEDHTVIQQASGKEIYFQSQSGVAENILEARWKAYESWKATSADSILRAVEILKTSGSVSKETVLLFLSYFSKYPNYFPQSAKAAAENNIRILQEEGFEAYSYRAPEISTKSSSVFPLASIGIVYEFATKILDNEEKRSDSFWKPLVDRIESLPGANEYIAKLPRVFSAIKSYGLQEASGTEFNYQLSKLLSREGMPRGFYMFLAGEISKALLEVVGYEINQVVQGNREAIEALQVLNSDPSVLQGGTLTPPKAEYESKFISIPDNFENLSLGLGKNDVYQVFKSTDKRFVVDGFNNELLQNHFGLVPGVAQVELLKHCFPAINDLERGNGVSVKFRGALLPYTQVRSLATETGFALVDAKDNSKIYAEVSSVKKEISVPSLPHHSQEEGEMMFAKEVLPHGNNFRFADHIFYDLEQKWSDTIPVDIESLVGRNSNIQELFKRTGKIPATLLVETVAQIAAAPIMRDKEKAEALFGTCDYRNLQPDFQFLATDQIAARCQYMMVKDHLARVQTSLYVIRDEQEITLIEGIATAVY